MTRTFRTAGLGLMALTALALTIFPARVVRSQDEKSGDKPSPVVGAWKLVEPKPPDGAEEIKFVINGRFVWAVSRDGRVAVAAGGKYTVDKDKYSETIDYVQGEGQAILVGKTFDFTWKVDGNTWSHAGTMKLGDQDLKIDEKWESCKADNVSPVEGAWKMVVQKNGEAQDYQKLPEGTEMIKYVANGRMLWTVTSEGKIVAAAGGKYTTDKDKYTESIDYVHGEGQAFLVGKTFNFTWKVDGNTWLHVGSLKVDDRDIKIDEKWERCK
jgi:hypothetical protein